MIWVTGLLLLQRAGHSLPWHESGEAPDSQQRPRGHSRQKSEQDASAKGISTARSSGIFGVAALVTLVAGVGLERSGDAIAGHIGLSGVLFGATILAAATSLPEVSTGLTSVRNGDDKLAVSDIFGGNAFLPVLFLRGRPAVRPGGRAPGAGDGHLPDRPWRASQRGVYVRDPVRPSERSPDSASTQPSYCLVPTRDGRPDRDRRLVKQPVAVERRNACILGRRGRHRHCDHAGPAGHRRRQRRRLRRGRRRPGLPRRDGRRGHGPTRAPSGRAPPAFSSRRSATCPSSSSASSPCGPVWSTSSGRRSSARSWPTRCSSWAWPSSLGGLRHGTQNFGGEQTADDGDAPPAGRRRAGDPDPGDRARARPTAATTPSCPSSSSIVLLVVFAASHPVLDRAGRTGRPVPKRLEAAGQAVADLAGDRRARRRGGRRGVRLATGSSRRSSPRWRPSACPQAVRRPGGRGHRRQRRGERGRRAGGDARTRADLAISLILNSSLQVALALVPDPRPLSLVVGAAPLTLVVSPLLVGALALSATSCSAALVVIDGESTWLEGAGARRPLRHHRRQRLVGAADRRLTSGSSDAGA